MNAPWKVGPQGNRDSFAAFICDETSLDVLRPVVIELGWQPEKCNKGGLRNAVQSLSITASPNILMVDLSESGDPLNDINALAEVCEPGTIVIAIGQVNDVRLYRDLIASGIHDYLLKPLSPAQVRDSLVMAQAVFAQPKHDAAGTKRHITTAVIGTRGARASSSTPPTRTSCRPRCSISTSISAPARCRSISSPAAVSPTRSRTRAASTDCSSSARW